VEEETATEEFHPQKIMESLKNKTKVQKLMSKELIE
jgi:hypothetical protein